MMREAKKRFLAAAAGTGIMAAIFAGTAWAEETRTEITEIELNIESSIEADEDDGEVSVTALGEGYYVEDVEIQNDNGEWVSGDVPRVKIYLEAEDDYYFGSSSSGAFTFTGDDADYVSASTKNSRSSLTLTVKLDTLMGDLDVEDAGWMDEESPVAVWEETSGAKSYEIKLYRGSSSVTSTQTTKNTYYDFSSEITRTGDYYYKIRAVYNSSNKGSWVESDSIYIDEDVLAAIQSGNYNSYYGTVSSGNTPGSTYNGSGGWQQDGIGWWYRNADGSYPAGCWQMINGLWYYFDASGYMKTGWVLWNGNWYYCNQTTGAMLTDAYTPDGYYVNADGIWVS